MKLRHVETNKTTLITDANDERQIRAAADRLVARTYSGCFADFGSVCINNLGHITRATISRAVGGLVLSMGETATFEVVD